MKSPELYSPAQAAKYYLRMIITLTSNRVRLLSYLAAKNSSSTHFKMRQEDSICWGKAINNSIINSTNPNHTMIIMIDMMLSWQSLIQMLMITLTWELLSLVSSILRSSRTPVPQDSYLMSSNSWMRSWWKTTPQVSPTRVYSIIPWSQRRESSTAPHSQYQTTCWTRLTASEVTHVLIMLEVQAPTLRARSALS